LFSVVIPVYKNELSIPELLVELARLRHLLTQPLEVIFVVDGSPDQSFLVLKNDLPRQPFASQLIAHSRNFGSFAAIRTGLARAKGRVVAVMAADLQEPIDLIQAALESLGRDEADIAIGTREGRNDGALTRLTSGLFWSAYRRLVMPEIPPGGVDVFACNTQVRDELIRLEERNSSLVGLLFWIGFRRKLIPYIRAERRHGRSAWSFSRKLTYLLDSVYSFSSLPLRLLKWSGVAAVLVSMGVGGTVILARAVGLIDVPGYTPTILMIMFFGGLNSFGLGILGDYVWRAFENTKSRPLALVRTEVSFSPMETPNRVLKNPLLGLDERA
jgi:glycosyltransferase involved in cell wall biosynthesis